MASEVKIERKAHYDIRVSLLSCSCSYPLNYWSRNSDLSVWCQPIISHHPNVEYNYCSLNAIYMQMPRSAAFYFNFWIIFWIYIFVTNHLHFLSSFQNKFHSSDEMLPIELKKTPIKISRSCDSIYQNIKTIRNTDAGGRCPKLPIALGTARILERGGGVCHNRLMKENLHQSDVM